MGICQLTLRAANAAIVCFALLLPGLSFGQSTPGSSTAPETLSNKTYVSPAFTGTATGSNVFPLALLANTATGNCVANLSGSTGAWTATPCSGLVGSITSGGVLYGASGSIVASSGALTSGAIVLGGGAGGAPNTLSGTGLVTATAGVAGTTNSPTVGNLTVTGTTQTGNLTTGGAVTLASSPLLISGNISTAAPLNNGIGINGSAAPTYTDTSGTGGTIATVNMFALPQVTLNSSVATAYTSVYSLFIPAPLCTGNATCTTLYGLRVNAITLLAAGLNANGGNVTLNGSSGYNTSINTGTSNGSIFIGNTGNTGKTYMQGLGTGTNADTLCLTSGNIVTIDAGNTCGVSSRRFKENIKVIKTTELPLLKSLPVVSFNRKPESEPNKDPNFAVTQVGLIAEDVSEKFPQCALYEDDMKTVKSWRETCMIAMLVKGVQEQSREIDRLKRRIH